MSLWDWETLFASIRYFRSRSSISAASFPRDIVERYWKDGNPYTDEDRRRIIHQLHEVEFRILSPFDKKLAEEMEPSWKKFESFINGLAEGLYAVHAAGNGCNERLICFRHEDKYIDINHYIANPDLCGYIIPECIKDVSSVSGSTFRTDARKQ